jgi:hypothetical protein
VTQRYLIKFLEQYYKTNDIHLHELNFKFIKDLEAFLSNHKPKDHQKQLNNNGVMKHIIRVKKMVNLGQQLDWIDGEPYAGYKKKQRVNREFLSKDELTEIKKRNLR